MASYSLSAEKFRSISSIDCYSHDQDVLNLDGSSNNCDDATISTAACLDQVCAICLDQVEAQPPDHFINKPSIGCEVSFEKPDGQISIVTFGYRPLGMATYQSTTNETNTVVVDRILSNSAAHKLGVKTGWIVRSIGGVRVDGFSTEEVLDLVSLCCEGLPMETTRCQSCSNVFHRGCLQHWVCQKKKTCPMCRVGTLPFALMTT